MPEPAVPGPAVPEPVLQPGARGFGIVDPREPDVRRLLDQHLAFAHRYTRPEDVHALDLAGLLDPAVTLYGLRQSGELVAVGALRTLGPDAAELKSMHTAAAVRGRGLGQALLEALLDVARERRLTRVSLETGAQEAFASARRLYASAGFTACGPFGGHVAATTSTFLTLELAAGP